MSANKGVATCALPPALVAFRSLKARSQAAWKTLNTSRENNYRYAKEVLDSCATLDDLLNHHGVFYFFLTRDAFLKANRMKKWSSDSLDEYILLTGTTVPLTVNRDDCIFISHYWITSDDPDPNGVYFKKIQQDLRQTGWSYIWLDFSCAPQSPRTSSEANYSTRILKTIPFLIRNCDYMFFYPPFEPRLWILYETAEYLLTSISVTQVYPDSKIFIEHVKEMMKTSVRSVLEKYNYRCSVAQDRALITAWLELIVILCKLKFDTSVSMDMLTRRHILDSTICFTRPNGGVFVQLLNSGGRVEVNTMEGYVSFDGQRHEFTPYQEVKVIADLA